MSVAGLTVALGGCGVGDSDDVTLTLVAADYGDSSANGSEEYWTDLVARFEADHPGITVDVRVHAWTDVDREVKAMVDAGDPPDLAQIGAYADYADQDLLYQAGDVLSIPVQADFADQFALAGQVHGVQYGMPFAASTRLLFYNKAHFEDAGLTPPTTWDELASAAGELKDAGVKYPYALPLGSEEAQAETMQWLLSGGAGYVDPNGSYAIDAPENVETFTWLRDELVGKELTGPVAPGELNRADAFEAFANGEVGMLNGHPSLMKMATAKDVEFGMVPVPGVEGADQATMGVADWMMAFKENGHRDQIAEFLDFVYSERNVLDFSRRYDLLPVTDSASEIMAGAKEDADLRPFLDELPLSELYPVSRTSWATVSAGVKAEIGKAVAQDGDPSAVLAALQSTAMSAESRGGSSG
ncbi:extracellular solute-binding protein [Streptomyces sp. NPDC048290]|uniref:ABC transporter substrate-binding protein n=1 Tax=Streptomyces sp. NPDC048290 TaxID=3155811 RepID=UPI003423A162